MQASSSWSPPTGVLGELVRGARERAAALRASSAMLERQATDRAPAPGFATALRRPDVALIAEVKRRSPSKGWINPGIDAAAQGAAYERGGAAAISVLTEPEQFGGSNADVEAVRDAVRIPVLKKDFHVDPIQLVEARALGAAAALLIVRALSPDELRSMLDAARGLALEVLVEARDAREIELALSLGAEVVGINNRNLETLRIDGATSERLLAMIPADRVGIAESGIAGRDDVERFARCGADAVLVGSAISAAADAQAAVRAMTGVAKERRGG